VTTPGRAVLVVDDEPALVRAMTRLLTYVGVDAVGACHGADALARLDERAFDLILCDVRMPVMDGPALLRTLRERGAPHPPVVFLTGYAERGDRELLALGAVAVRGKPIEANDLFELVRTLGADAPA
jgi:CheY-like chemotaxis protein